MKRIAFIVVTLALMVSPAMATAAGSSTCQAYNPQTCSVGTQTGTSTTAGTLPFTGLDLGLLVAGGLAMLAGGLVVRRLSRKPNGS